MVAAISPADINYEETLSTLRSEAVVIFDKCLFTNTHNARRHKSTPFSGAGFQRYVNDE